MTDFYVLLEEGRVDPQSGELLEERLIEINLGYDEDLNSRIVGVAVYSAPDGEVQRSDLERYEHRNAYISRVSAADLYETIKYPGVPSSVFYDGVKYAASQFKERFLKPAL